MQRRKFDVRYPVRPIRLEDARVEFHSDLFELCRITLQGLCRNNAGMRHVWVYVHRGKIAAVMAFDDWHDHLHLEIITNNFALPPDLLRGERPGTRLYAAMEYAARKAGIRKITLESVPDRVGYWERLGFRASRPSYDGGLCVLHPMEKYL